MPGRRDAVRMSEHEVGLFLAENAKVQVASIGASGSPHLTTLFYVVEHGALAFWTYARSQTVRNLERDPRLSALVEAGEAYGELRGVSISGRAELVLDTDRIRAIGSSVTARMLGVATADELGDLGRATVEDQVAKRVAVVVRPGRVASWDPRKLR